MKGHDDLRDSTFVAVAAGNGVGSRVAQMLAARGARLVLTARHPDALAALAAEVGGTVVTADAVCWLLGPHSAWVTGQVIGVDGGLATLKPRVKADSRA